MNDLEQKEFLSKIIIEKAFKEHDREKCAVACSFGKDSMLVLYLVRLVYPDVKVVFCNTGVEYPETIAFKKRMVAEWNLNFIEARSDGETFWTIAKKDGLPGIRLDGKVRVPRCCRELKDKPGMKAYRDNGVELCFTGITFAESRNRFMLSKRCGDYYFAKTDGIWKCHPIMSWTEAEVYAYHDLKRIPLNPIYDKYGRTCRVGCMPCTSYRSWVRVMAMTSPTMYRKIQAMRGQELFE